MSTDAQLINNRNLFLTVLETGKSKSKVPAGSTKYIYSIWLEPTSWFINSHLLTVSSYGRRGKRALWGLFCKGTNSINEGPTLMT